MGKTFTYLGSGELSPLFGYESLFRRGEQGFGRERLEGYLYVI